MAEETDSSHDLASRVDRPFFRYIVLAASCMLTFGSYYVFDLPSAIEQDLISYLNISLSDYSQFYTAYTVANFLSVCFGGYLLDRTGTRIGAVVFTALICTGQLIWALGGSFKSYATMIVGRAVYGLGGGCITVCEESISTHYFKGKELAMAFGATLCISRLGSVLNFFISPIICDAVGVSATLWISASICFLSIIFVLTFCWLDRIYQLAKHSTIVTKTKKIHLKDLFSLRVEFWFLCAICGIFYSCIFPFVAISKELFMSEWTLDSWTASVVTGIVYDVALVLSIPLGWVVDKIGQRLTLLIVATGLVVLSNFLMLFCRPSGTHQNVSIPYISMIIMGFAYCFTASSLWSGISLVVRKMQVGSAMALTTAVEMLANTIFQAVQGAITEAFGYDGNLICFVALSCVSAGLVLILLIIDKKNYKILNTKDSTGIFKDTVENQEEQPLVDENSEQTGSEEK